MGSVRRKLSVEEWRHSFTRTFYNSPAYGAFLSRNGGNLLWEALGESFLVPVIEPTVWTWWRGSKIPIPPKFGLRTSGFMGMHSLRTPGVSAWDEFVNLLASRERSRFSIPSIQPVLIESGLLADTEYLQQSLAARGLEGESIVTRVIELPQLGPEAQAIAIDDLVTNDFLEHAISMQLIESYDKKRRYDIRRAPKLGVRVQTIEVSSDEQALSVYESVMSVHRQSVKRTGLGGHSLEYWTGLSGAVRLAGGQDIVSLSHTIDGELLAVVVAHKVGKSVFYQMNSSSAAALEMSANPITLHAAIVAATLLGGKYFETGRQHESDGEKSQKIFSYKSQFGGKTFSLPNFHL